MRDAEMARQRDDALLKQGGGTAPVITRQEIVPPLRAGLLTSRRDDARGTLFPQPRILSDAAKQLLDEIVGYGWRIVLDGRRVSLADVEESWMKRKSWIKPITIGGDGIRECDGIVAEWFDRNGCVAAVVRPDHYVYGTAPDFRSISNLTREAELFLSKPRAEAALAAG
jgi:3-(3-hydroxy-phenyl)propionate hydroxylase